MRSLPQVTLVAIDGTNHPGSTIILFEKCDKQVAFGASMFVGTIRYGGNGKSWLIPTLDLDGYNRFCLRQLWKIIPTTHCLTVQADSGINNPEAWDDTWLQYDYIGAPWPINHGGYTHRVGNSGFCLRSKRLLEATAKIVKEDYAIWQGSQLRICRDDVVTCVRYRVPLERMGMKFAPVEVAAKFAFELPTSEAATLTNQFGFHAAKKP